MVKREKKQKPSNFDREEEEDDEEQVKPSNSLVVLSSDDEEANEDLSLKIVERAMLRACTTDLDDAVFGDGKSDDDGGISVGGIDLTPSSLPEAEIVTDLKNEKKRKEKKKKSRKFETEEEAVDAGKEEEKAETGKTLEIDKLMEKNAVEISDNTVLRKLLRGPRYFDPPGNSWGTCYNCGEEGHTFVSCTLAKRKKPCFLCGSLEHHAKQCKKGQDCFICKKGGHRAKDCPDKYKVGSQSSKICLKCGDSGHDMFSCENDYSLDDLKEIQCYICKSVGHLSCAKFIDTSPREASCYRCGQLGHTGLGCARSYGETAGAGSPSSCYKCGEGGHFARECTSSAKGCARSYGETAGAGTPSSCYKCGEEGHFARECTNSAKRKRNIELSTPSGRSYKGNGEYAGVKSVQGYARLYGETAGAGSSSPNSCYKCGGGGHFARECTSSAKVRKRNIELSTTNGRFSKENGVNVGVRSVPHDLGKAGRKKKSKHEEEYSSPSRQRGGWITEDPGDFPRSKARVNGWRSPNTPTHTWNQIPNLNADGHAQSSYSFKKSLKLHFGSPASNVAANVYQHRFSASRFGNSSSDGTRRNYGW
ncbi:protein AIR2-like isoform X2 [Cornus florida]|uniref:protein AIR2-like isoform X2 n=1 Tax=Cornus florida TaxID=4283 RepID=UPI00289D718C|nr:protein AIR2-like isoform X2 [Cornus florida]